MTHSRSALIALISLGFFSSILCAQETAPRPPSSPSSPGSKPTVVPPDSPAAPTSPGAVIFKPVFHLLDSDNDGWVSRKEAESVPDLAKDFARYDLNRDGRLDRGEFDRYAARK